MRAGCVKEERCTFCPVLLADEEYRDESADQIDGLVHEGVGIDGTNLTAEDIKEVSLAIMHRYNGAPEDLPIVMAALVIINSGLCDKVWSEA